MPNQRSLAVGLGLFVATAVVGCNNEETKPIEPTAAITPGMDKMKGEMMENFKKQSPGAKKALATPKPAP